MNWRAARLHARRPAEVRLEIVQDEHEDATVEFPTVCLDVRLDRRPLEERRILPFDGKLDAGEHGNRLRLALFADLEVVLREIADELALRVGDTGVDFDVIDFDLERRRGLSGTGSGRRLRLSGRAARPQAR